jgi:hypothetical protein
MLSRTCRHLAVALLLVGLSGCAGNILRDELPKYRGLHVDDLIRRLGLPDGETQVAGRRIVFWKNDRSGSISIPQYNTGTFNAYGSGGYTTGTYGYTTYNTVPVSYNCIIKAVIDSSNTIQDLEYDGNQGGCMKYARRLDGASPF